MVAVDYVDHLAVVDKVREGVEERRVIAEEGDYRHVRLRHDQPAYGSKQMHFDYRWQDVGPQLGGHSERFVGPGIVDLDHSGRKPEPRPLA